MNVAVAIPRRDVTGPRVQQPPFTAGSGRWVTAALIVMAAAYAGFFVFDELHRFDAFLMHALDMGNMEQAVWNTAHGHPFAFNNLRFASGIEASGTNTRLSFHVEPILLLVAIPYLFFTSPVTLMVIQAVVVASGVFPAAWLARRYLGSPLAQLAFPAAYLLAPPLEAATLYEFHAVTLSAAFLLWALYFADGRRYAWFVVFAVLAMSTKEEIGLVVGMMGLWIWWRHRDRTVGLTTAILAVGWSLFTVLVIMRHFSHGHSSPYCARFNPYQMNGQTTDPLHTVTSCVGVAKIWLQHPDQVWSILVVPQKVGFVHRIMMPGGYLAVLSPLTLAISLPSYAVILLSSDVHMYSGLGHYPAELVPIVIGAAIIGTSWLAYRLAPKLRISPRLATAAACLWLLVASVTNQRVNGFTPLYEGFSLPQATPHDAVARRLLSLIPSNATVSAGDYFNPFLSDRFGIYLFPDHGDAQYVAVDESRDYFPLHSYDEAAQIQKMLASGAWGVVFAQDGCLLLERRRYAPQLPTALPRSFYSFVVPSSPPRIAHPLLVWFGPSLRLLGYDVERTEQVNLRLPDVVLTTYWEVSSPLTAPITPVVYLTNGAGAIDFHEVYFPATNWLPATRWPSDRTIVVRTVPLTVFSNENGDIDIDLAVYAPGSYDVLADATHRYRPNVRWTPGLVPMEVVDRGSILKLTHVSAQW